MVPLQTVLFTVAVSVRFFSYAVLICSITLTRVDLINDDDGVMPRNLKFKQH